MADYQSKYTGEQIDEAIGKALEGGGSGGGLDDVVFYPNVINYSGTYTTPSAGETIKIEVDVAIDTYAILQPYAGDYYFKRVLAKCKSQETTVTEVTINSTRDFNQSSIPQVGTTIDTWSDKMGEVGDYIALHVRNQIGSNEFQSLGWVLTQLIDLQSGAHHYLKVVAILPSNYDGTLGTQTLTAQISSFDVITVLDGELNVGDGYINFYSNNGEHLGGFTTNQSYNQDIYLSTGATVAFTQTLTSGTQIGTLNVNGIDTPLYAPTPPEISIPKLYAPTIKISELTLTIKNPVKNKDYVASYDIYNADTNTIIRNTKNTTVDLESFDIADGTYNIAVKAKGIEFNGTLLYEESDYSNVLSYTHDNPPTLASGADWYKATVDKSTITEITFDNTYTVTGNETESWDASESIDGSVMCYLNGTSITIKPIHTTNKVHANRSCYQMFKGFTRLITINNLTALDTSNVTTMSWMFNGCNTLTTLDVSGFDTSNVVAMPAMFQNCNALTSLDVSGFNTSNVKFIGSMFQGCNKLTTLDVSGFDTGNVTDMLQMFFGCTNLTADCSTWDVTNVTSYSGFNTNAPNVTPPEW